jgi:hypothetical protein
LRDGRTPLPLPPSVDPMLAALIGSMMAPLADQRPSARAVEGACPPPAPPAIALGGSPAMTSSAASIALSIRPSSSPSLAQLVWRAPSRLLDRVKAASSLMGGGRRERMGSGSSSGSGPMAFSPPTG